MLPSGLPSALPSGGLAQLFPVFQAQGGSNLTGGGIVTDVEDGASVVLGVVAPGAAEMLPAAIIEGDCASQTGSGPTPPAGMFPEPAPSGEASPGAASPAAESPAASEAPAPSPTLSTEFPLWLTPVAVGTSNSVIGVKTADLTASPHAIVINTSPEDPTLLACADLQEGAPAPASPGSSPAGGGTESPAASGGMGASPATSP
jgi:hypothetical protein